MENILESQDFQCRVSSVLNRDATQYGKILMFDGKEDTCWCSENESPQWVALQWKSPRTISAYNIQFQGGFVGHDCEIILVRDDGSKAIEPFYPEDNNSVQKFQLKAPCNTKQVTVKFNSSTDFFGRIIIYKFELYS
ncbi:nuclear receptor 2C2-associated protein [Arctopsyche grandis]|uniref:nuclear receptor 2C2-associated protein n=1 Tax=Arctopsyche grandis TaxID=121162 RepID=UPI00406D7A54